MSEQSYEFNVRRPGPTTVIAPRTSITAPSARRAKDDHRDHLAADLEAYLAAGGEIETLPGPGNGTTRRVNHGGVMGL